MTAGQLTIEPLQHVPAARGGAAVPAWISVGLWLAASAIVAGWLALVVLHVRDDYRVTHTQGVWIAVADAARSGRLYPPLVEDGRYSGTRYMPLPILLNSAAASAAGDALIGGKVVAAGLMAVLLALVLLLLRRLSCPLPLAAALAAVIVATEAGLQAGTTIGGDLLPVVLQVGALLIVLRGRSTASMIASGSLAGLAMASKLTGLWGAVAVATWLAVQFRRRDAAVFAAACFTAAALVLGSVEVATAGGLSSHLLAFSLAGVERAPSLLRAPNQLLYNLRGYATGAVVLLPLAALGALLSGGWRQLSLIHLSLGYALLLLLVVYNDIGTGFNQLLDVVVLTMLAVGCLAGRTSSGDARTGSVLLLAISIAVLWAAAVDLVRTVAFDARRAASTYLAGAPPARAAWRVAGMLRPDQKVLTEDPSIDVAARRQPVVMDPFMLNRLERRDPKLVDPLIQAIVARRFDVVVLVVPVEDRSFDVWWDHYHFGPRVADALRRSYRADGIIGRYYLYRPAR